MRIGMIGLGSFGSAIGNLLAENGHDVIGWELNSAVVTEINEKRRNTAYLPDVEISSNLCATTNFTDVFKVSDAVFIAVPARFIRGLLEPVRKELPENAFLVNLAKGFDVKTGLTAFQTIKEVFPYQNKAILSGPSIAREIARHSPTSVVMAGTCRENMTDVAEALENDFFQVCLSDDVVGVELGGILKNIYSIGLGILDSYIQKRVNFRSVYLTFALEEMARFGISRGAKNESFYSLAGMGDLLVTSFSEHSHNRHMGELLQQGRSVSEIKAEMGVLPEGYTTLQIVLEKVGGECLPLAQGTWDVIHNRITPEDFGKLVINMSC